MKQTDKKDRIFSLLPFVEMIFGMFLIIFSNNSLSMIIKMVGIIAFSVGMWLFARALQMFLGSNDKDLLFPLTIFSVFLIAGGLFLIIRADSILTLSTIVFGILVGALGVSKIPLIVKVIKSKFRLWWITIIPTLAIIGLGVYIGLNPTISEVSEYSLPMILFGVALIIGFVTDNFANCAIAFAETHPHVKKEKKKAEKEPENGEQTVSQIADMMESDSKNVDKQE